MPTKARKKAKNWKVSPKSRNRKKTRTCAEFLIIIFCYFIVPFAFANPTELPELVIYTYDSFAAKGGIGPEIIPGFEKQCQCKVRLLVSGDSGQILSRLQMDSKRDRPTAHLVVGLDQNLWERAKPWIEPWGDWVPKGYEELDPKTKIDKGFLPYDYGIFTWIADRKKLERRKIELGASASLQDLLKPEFRRQILLEDPRSSTPGMAFLLYTYAVLGKKKAPEFWSKFKSQWLTLAPGWDSAYGLFLKGEAPIVWSYTTSQAYHEEHEETATQSKERRYFAVLFKEGQPMQIEGAAFVKGALKSPWDRERARAFLEYLISPEVQKKIPKKNWMFPSLKDVPVPESFHKLPKVRKIVHLTNDASQIENILSDWNQIVSAPGGR